MTAQSGQGPLSAASSTLSLFFALRDVRDPRLGASHRAVLYALLAHRNEGDVSIKASVAQIGTAAGLSAKQARRVIHELRSLGYLAFPDFDRSAARQVTRYTLVLLGRAELLPPMGVAATPAHGSSEAGAELAPYSHPREEAAPAHGSSLLPPVGASADLSADPSADLSEGTQGKAFTPGAFEAVQS